MTPHPPQRPWPYGYVSLEELRVPARKRRRPAARHGGRARALQPRPLPRRSQRGVALVLVIAAITILAVFVADLMENTTTDFHVATAERDRLKAEYLAKSGVNLTRLLIAHEEQIRAAVGILLAPLYRGGSIPQLNVWDFADVLLAPFADASNAQAMSEETGIDFSMMEGLKDAGGTFEVITVPENSKINLNRPLFFSGDDAKRNTAEQLFALLGGYQSPNSPFDPMFSARDPDGNYTTRLDIVSAMIDWWDEDEQRTVFDPGNRTLAVGGSEDDIYGQYEDPYVIKNAPFDSLEEIRMIRGVGDDFWATFVEDDPDDPRKRKVTIYASGAVNVNLAPPAVLLARICAFVIDEPLCQDPVQAAAFVQLMDTIKAFVPVPLFASDNDFLNFMTGRAGGAGGGAPGGSPGQPGAAAGGGGGGSGNMILDALNTFLGPDNPLMSWTRLTLTPEERNNMRSTFITQASIFTIQATGHVGRAEAKMSMVVNFDRPRVLPRGVAGSLPALGVAHHYKLE